MHHYLLPSLGYYTRDPKRYQISRKRRCGGLTKSNEIEGQGDKLLLTRMEGLRLRQIPKIFPQSSLQLRERNSENVAGLWTSGYGSLRDG